MKNLIKSKKMKPLLHLIVTVLAGILWMSSTALADNDKGFVSLFNGQDLKGWQTPSGDHSWKVVNGVIDYEAKGGDLTSEKKFKDYPQQI